MVLSIIWSDCAWLLKAGNMTHELQQVQLFKKHETSFNPATQPSGSKTQILTIALYFSQPPNNVKLLVKWNQLLILVIEGICSALHFLGS